MSSAVSRSKLPRIAATLFVPDEQAKDRGDAHGHLDGGHRLLHLARHASIGFEIGEDRGGCDGTSADCMVL
jgi:hypothetical protein